MDLKQVYTLYEPNEETHPEHYQYCPGCSAELSLKESGHHLRPTCPECGFVHCKNPSPTVSVLVQQAKQVLLGKRLGHPGAGLWAQPSGYIEYEDDLEEVGWFPLGGPLPEMAFEEDRALLEAYARAPWEGIPISPVHRDRG